MKKKLLVLLILITCLIFCPKTTSNTQAETLSNDNSFVIDTLYPKDILDYQNLTDITNITINNNYIAYTLNTNNLYILNKTTKSIININDFNNIIEIKYVSNNQLIIINYDETNKTGSINVITLSENNTYSISTLDTINIDNLMLIDIYDGNGYVLIGIIKSNISSDSVFELYKITNTNLLENPEKIDQFSNEQFNNAYLMTITANKHFVLFENTSNEHRIITRTYGSTTITPTNVLNNIQLIDYYNYNDKEYLVAFTKENLSLISLDNFTSPLYYITNLEITDIEIINNTIYISETQENIISSYIVTEFEDNTVLKEDAVLISSAHNSLGRFNQVSDIFVQGNTLIVSDTNNDRIQIIDDELVCSKISDFNVDLHPHSVLLDSNRNLYFVKSQSSLTSSIEKYVLDNDDNYIHEETYTTINNNELGLVSDTTISNKDIIYIIDYTNNKLLSLNKNTGLQEKYTFQFTTSIDTKIEYLKDLNLITILNNNIIYLLDPLNFENHLDPILDTIDVDQTRDISCDTNSIYTLHDKKINLITINDNSMQISDKSLQNDDFTKLSTITYDIVNRKMYAFNSQKQCIVYFDCELSENPFNFSQIKNNELVDTESSPFAINVINNGIIYDMPYSLGKQYPNISNCIGIELFGDYYRVLFEYDNVLNIGFLDKSNANIITHDTIRKIRVITTNLQVPVYKYPTILKYENQAIITSYIPINTYINISYYDFPISIDTKQFYAYEYNGKIGYIFNADVVLDDSTNITNLHTNNASINAIGENEIYIYDEDKTTIIATLTNDDKIYVESYDKNSEYTKVVYKNEDLNTITGYIKTDYIQMDELDNSRIILICIIIASIIILIVITISYIVIKKKK